MIPWVERKTFVELEEEVAVTVEGARKRNRSAEGRLETRRFESTCSPLNPDAPCYDFKGAAGERQFGQEGYEYYPLPAQDVKAWFDYIRWLQFNGIVLPAEYTAYVAEIAKLLGVDRNQPEPQTVEYAEGQRAGSYVITWYVDARKLKSNDKQIVSPPIFVRHPRSGEQYCFYAGIYPEGWTLTQCDANFKKADGRGTIQMKCNTRPKDKGRLPIRFGFSLGNGIGQDKAWRHGMTRFGHGHDTAELHAPVALWDFPCCVTRDFLLPVHTLIEF